MRIDNHVRAVRGEPVPACTIQLAQGGSTEIGFYPTCPAQQFELVSGQLTELRADRDFSRATCLGSYLGETIDSRPDPAAGSRQPAAGGGAR